MTFGDNFFNIAVVDQAGANKMVGEQLMPALTSLIRLTFSRHGQSETLLAWR